MKMQWIKLCLASFLAMLSVSAQAVDLKGVLGIGYDVGGDLLMSGTYSNGGSWEVRANQGLAINGGLVAVTGDFETQATVGYKFGGPTASNGSVTFDVVPIELMEFYRTTNIRLGAGVSYHSSPKLKVDISGSSLNGEYKFNSATGFVAQIGWAPRTASYSVDLRYTSIKYTPSNPAQWTKSDFSGSVTGIYASVYF